MQSHCQLLSYMFRKSRDIERYGRVALSGPAVLICNPNQGKVCVCKEKAMFVLSDCAIVLCTKSINDAMLVADTICEQWLQFRTIYQEQLLNTRPWKEY